MLSMLYMGMSGLRANSQALEAVSNNVQNMNTIGFKKSSMNFAELFSQSGDTGSGRNTTAGAGVVALGSVLDMTAGDPFVTGRDLDLKINGDSFFILRDKNGGLSYTRTGQFEFNADNVLVSSLDPEKKVMALAANGSLSEINLSAKAKNTHVSTTAISFARAPVLGTNVSPSVDVYDSTGAKHTLTLQFTRSATPPPAGFGPTVELVIKEGDTVYNGSTPTLLKFDVLGKLIDPAGKELNFSLNPSGAASANVKLSLSNVTAYSSGTTPSLDHDSLKADGHAGGVISTRLFDGDGNLELTYSNGEKLTSDVLALAKFGNTTQLQQTEDGRFLANGKAAISIGTPNAQFGQIVTKALEKSNVDLTAEFGQLILFQRSFQANSQVVSTGNELLQMLFQMKGH